MSMSNNALTSNNCLTHDVDLCRHNLGYIRLVYQYVIDMALTALLSSSLHPDFFAKILRNFVIFGEVLQVFRSFRTCSDPFGRVRTFSDLFGHIRMHSDGLGSVRKFSENFETIRKFCQNSIVFDSACCLQIVPTLTCRPY